MIHFFVDLPVPVLRVVPQDPFGPFRTPWDPLGPLRTPWDPLGPLGIQFFHALSGFFITSCKKMDIGSLGTPWDPLGPLGTTSAPFRTLEDP